MILFRVRLERCGAETILLVPRAADLLVECRVEDLARGRCGPRPRRVQRIALGDAELLIVDVEPPRPTVVKLVDKCSGSITYLEARGNTFVEAQTHREGPHIKVAVGDRVYWVNQKPKPQPQQKKQPQRPKKTKLKPEGEFLKAEEAEEERLSI